MARGSFLSTVGTPTSWQCTFRVQTAHGPGQRPPSLRLSALPRGQRKADFSLVLLFNPPSSTLAIRYVNVLADLLAQNTRPISTPFVSSNLHIQIKSWRGRPILVTAWQDQNKFRTLPRVPWLVVPAARSAEALFTGGPSAAPSMGPRHEPG